MSFSNPFATKTDDVTRIFAAEVNAAGVSISQAVDGTGGGTYQPSAKIQIGGSGVELIDGTWPMLNSRTITRHESPILGLRRAWLDQKNDWVADAGYAQPPWSGHAHLTGIQCFYFHTLPGSETNNLYLDSSTLKLSPIHGATLTKVEFNTQHKNDGVGSVQQLPQCQLFRQQKTLGGAVQVISDIASMSLTDSVWTLNEVVAYTGALSAIDNETYDYYLQVYHPRTTASGHAFRSALMISAVRSTHVVTSMML